ncbi:MAG: ABC-F family ATP-binding cassette domain-containing protein [Clostridia bacterium]|nr:ABC-F family ATP-binding cassette domain-containing protein [Clostridia bacterium]
MVLLSASHISKAFGTEQILENVSFNVEEGDKIGILGMNGAGKSTLFKILTEDYTCDEGEIYKARQLKISYMEQFARVESERNAYDEVLFGAFSHLLDLEAELAVLQKELENDHSPEKIARYDRLNNQFIAEDGLIYKNLTVTALQGLGFSEEEMRLPMTALSGGQRTRACLARMLLEKADILLLDEPTNHLDISAITWLENFLCNYKGTVMLITHDRYFLDKTTNRIFDISHHKLREYRGNYSKYRAEKELQEASIAKEYALKTKEIARLEGIITQQKQWNRERNIKTAESKQKVIDRIKEGLITPEEIEKSIKFRFTIREGCGNDVLDVIDLAKGFDGVPLFQNLNMEIKKGETVFLLGANGCGKSTLFHLLTGKLKPDRGHIKRGSRVEIAYYDQHQADLDPEKTIFDEISDAQPTLDNTTIRCALAAFLFTGEDVFKPISTLSGGERARVSLTKLMLSKANFLLLDEPTNHLDIPSKEALEKALAGYDGTLFVISHDRYFIQKLATRITELTPDGLKSYGGNYEYYLEQTAKTISAEPEKKVKSGGEQYRLNKELESQKRKLATKVKRAEEQIADLEQQIEALENQIADPSLSTDYGKLNELTEQLNQKSCALEDAMLEWEESLNALNEIS